MEKQILEALKAKFDGVSESILSRTAKKLSRTATTEEQVTTAVEGVTFQSLLESYGDSRATEAQQTAVANYEQKHGLKDGMKVEEKGAEPIQANEPTNENGGTESTPAWVKALIDSNKKLSERLDQMEGEKITATRRQQVTQITEKLPEGLRRAYERTPVDNLSEEAFGELLAEITAEVEGIVQVADAKGAVYGFPTNQGKQVGGEKELTKAQLEAISRRGGETTEGQPF